MTTIYKILGYIGQYFLNWLNLFDHAINCALLGDADETVSARTARARNAGSKPACYFCMFLTWAAKVVTFGAVTGDHCDYALDKSVKPNSREIWSWSKGEINADPVNIVTVIENTDK